MNKPNEAVATGNGEEATQYNAVVRALKLGLDLHYRQVTVGMQEDGGWIKAAGKMSYGAFLNWLQKKLEEGWQIYSCYEPASPNAPSMFQAGRFAGHCAVVLLIPRCCLNDWLRKAASRGRAF